MFVPALKLKLPQIIFVTSMFSFKLYSVVAYISGETIYLLNNLAALLLDRRTFIFLLKSQCSIPLRTPLKPSSPELWSGENLQGFVASYIPWHALRLNRHGEEELGIMPQRELGIFPHDFKYPSQKWRLIQQSAYGTPWREQEFAH